MSREITKIEDYKEKNKLDIAIEPVGLTYEHDFKQRRKRIIGERIVIHLTNKDKIKKGELKITVPTIKPVDVDSLVFGGMMTPKHELIRWEELTKFAQKQIKDAVKEYWENKYGELSENAAKHESELTAGIPEDDK
ncbi:MAG: hypothetical protein HYW77_03400 [Parcubacteria group bacterium]|nr:hypothetical protein [Parcubacteria group bacterium]